MRKNEVHPYVSVIKPAARNRKADPWLLSHRHPVTGKKLAPSAGTNKAIAERKAAELSLEIQKARMGEPSVFSTGGQKWSQTTVTLNVEGDKEKRITGFREALCAGNTDKHVSETCMMIYRVLKQLGVSTLAEIQMSHTDVRVAINQIPRETGAGGFSERRKDAHLRALKSFGAWLEEKGRLPAHPWRKVENFKPDSARVYYRHALSDDQMSKLVLAAESQTRRAKCGLNGPQRAMLYRTAVGTGFRYGTLTKLTVGMLRLDSDSPFIHTPARINKNRKDKDQPIGLDLAAMLRTYVAGLPKAAPLFEIRPHANIVVVLRNDLRAAGISPEQAPGVVIDFHCFRHTYITNVVRSGGLAQAQRLAGHSTPVLTMRYSHLDHADYAKTLAKVGTPGGGAEWDVSDGPRDSNPVSNSKKAEKPEGGSK